MIVMDWDKSLAKDAPLDKCVYRCTDCTDVGRNHEIVDVEAGATDRTSCWGAGIPTTKRRCTGCGDEDGPWVSAATVGGGW
jgi:hypothetical protein